MAKRTSGDKKITSPQVKIRVVLETTVDADQFEIGDLENDFRPSKNAEEVLQSLENVNGADYAWSSTWEFFLWDRPGKFEWSIEVDDV